VKVLVTGGTGYLGPRLVRRLAEEGHEIFLVGRSGGAQTAAAVFVRADITSPPEMAAARKATGPVDLLVHLAAKVPRTLPEDRAGDMTRVQRGGHVERPGDVWRRTAACGVRQHGGGVRPARGDGADN